jgi:hypothetical protein
MGLCGSIPRAKPFLTATVFWVARDFINRLCLSPELRRALP